MNNIPEIFKTYPAVYAVGDRYIITVAVNEPCTMWAKIGENEYSRIIRLVCELDKPLFQKLLSVTHIRVSTG